MSRVLANLEFRGSKGSYQKWADQIGDQSWTFENTLSYFQKSVKFTPPNIDALGPGADVNYDPAAFSPSGGPLHVSYSNYYQPLSPGLIRGLQAIGLENIPGLNSGNLIGYAHGTTTIDPHSETRSSSETSFLQEALIKTTLQVYQNTLARNIIFGANKTATGVNVTTGSFPSTGSRTYVLNARKEVILSAGAVSEPLVPLIFKMQLYSSDGTSSTRPKCSWSPVLVRRKLWKRTISPYFLTFQALAKGCRTSRSLLLFIISASRQHHP